MDRRTQFRDLLERCEAVGWRVKYTRKNHTMILSNNGNSMTLPGTSHGYGTAYKNALAWAKRNGLEDLERRRG